MDPTPSAGKADNASQCARQLRKEESRVPARSNQLRGSLCEAGQSEASDGAALKSLQARRRNAGSINAMAVGAKRARALRSRMILLLTLSLTRALRPQVTGRRAEP